MSLGTGLILFEFYLGKAGILTKDKRRKGRTESILLTSPQLWRKSFAEEGSGCFINAEGKSR